MKYVCLLILTAEQRKRRAKKESEIIDLCKGKKVILDTNALYAILSEKNLHVDTALLRKVIKKADRNRDNISHFC